MTALETLKDFMILLAQPRRRGHIRPGDAAFHAGDFLGDLTKLEKQGRRRLPRPDDRAAVMPITVDEIFEALAQLAGQGAQLGKLESRQVGGIFPRPTVALDTGIDGAGADAEPPGDGADRTALEIIDLDRRPIDLAPGPVVGF